MGDTAWRSGWLGIEAYGLETHGFAVVRATGDGSIQAEVHWLAGNAEVYTPFRLRHDPAAGSVILLVSDDGEPHGDDEDEDDNSSSGWSVEDTTSVPADLAPQLSPDALDRAFCVMAFLQDGMFTVLDDADGLGWDHHWLPGPGPDDLWRPLDVGRGPWPTMERSSAPPATAGPVRVRQAVGPEGAGYLADLGEMHLFVTTATGAWTPLFFGEQLAGYDCGDEVELDDVEEPTRDVLRSKIGFLTGNRPMS